MSCNTYFDTLRNSYFCAKIGENEREITKKSFGYC